MVNEDAPTAPVNQDSRDVVDLLGSGMGAIASFHALLADEGVQRGLIGPREVPRLWERHLLNSAAVAQYLPETGSVVDVGSGAGLPGIVLAAMRPDLQMILLEPMERRVIWLDEVVAELALTNARVMRGRAEDLAGTLLADAVTARAVAPMDKLASWTLPLLRQGAPLLALKGSRAAEELESAREVIGALGGDAGEVLVGETVTGVAPTAVVRVRRTAPSVPARSAGTSGRRSTGGAGKQKDGGAPRARAQQTGRRPGRSTQH